MQSEASQSSMPSQGSDAPPAVFRHLNLAVVGAAMPIDALLDQPAAADLVLPHAADDDIFAQACRRMEARSCELRHTGNFVLIVEPYQPAPKAPARVSPAPTEIPSPQVKPTSRSSLRRSVVSAIRELSKTPVLGRRPPESRLGPGFYAGVVSRLPDSGAPRRPLYKFSAKVSLDLGYGALGPGRYSPDDSAIRPRAPSACVFRPHHAANTTDIARLIDKDCQIGPGTYNVCEPTRRRPSSAIVRPDANCVANKSALYEQQDRPGPGTYTIRDGQVRPRPPSASFIRASLRSVFDLGNDDPGPGAYTLPHTFRDASNARVSTFGTADRFARKGRVYQRIKEFHFRRAKPGRAASPTAIDPRSPSIVDGRVSRPEPGANPAPAPASRPAIRRKSISTTTRHERERKKDLWRAKLLALDITALALDAETEYRPVEEQKKKIQFRWLRLMPVASRTAWVCNLLLTYRINRDQIIRAKRAATRIQRWFRRICAVRRRRKIRRLERSFGRVLLRKFRARQFRQMAARKHEAAEIIKATLIFEKRKLLKGVKTFRHKIVRLQNWWKAHLRQCAAMFAVLDRQWIDLEHRIFFMYAEEETRQAMTKVAKHTASSGRRTKTAATVRDDAPVPRASDADRRAYLAPIVAQKHRAWVVARREWDGVGPEPWLRIILPPLQTLDLIKAAQDALPEDVMSKVVKLKLQKFIRRLVQQYSQ